jgi:hypothetical protein
VHVNGPEPFPFGPPVDSNGLSEKDEVRAERFNDFQRNGMVYLSICWFTQSGASSANIIYEGMRAFRAFVEQAAKADPDEQWKWVPI